MPVEQLAQLPSTVTYLVVGGGFTGVGAVAYLGLSKLAARFEAWKESNDADHKEIKEKLDHMNGQIDANTTAIATRAAVCRERHGK